MKQVEEAPQMDWQQVALNGGPPCFALLDDEEGWYCGRAERWEGHDGEHEFVSLDDFITAERIKALEDAAKVADTTVREYVSKSLAPDEALIHSRNDYWQRGKGAELTLERIRALISSTPASADPIDRP